MLAPAQTSRSVTFLSLWVFTLGTILVGVTGCSTPATKPARHLQFDVGWVRDTVHLGYEGVQGSHFMSPVINGDLVYQGNAIDGLVAYDRKTGTERWKVKIKNGVASGAQISGDRIFFGASDGQFYCVEKVSGRIVWTFPARAEILAAPLVDNGSVFFLAANNILYSLDAATGKQRWLYARSQPAGLSIRSGSRPTVVDQTLYAGFSDGALVALRVKDGGLVWERVLTTNGRFRDVDGSPAVYEDLLIVATFGDGLYAITRKDGQIHWKFDEGGADSAVVKDDKVFFSTERDRVVSLDAKSGKLIWSWQALEGSPTAPTVLKDFVLVGQSRGHLVALNALTGLVEGSYATGKGITAQPTVDDKSGEIFVFSSFANLFEMHMNYVRTSMLGERSL
jgi:outer membrane protein assembly factor BamB